MVITLLYLLATKSQKSTKYAYLGALQLLPSLVDSVSEVRKRV